MIDRDLVYILRKLLAQIQKVVGSIDDEYRAKSRQHQPPNQIDIQSPVRLEPTITEFYASEQRDRPKKVLLENVRLVLECVAVGAAIFAAIYTFRTLDQVQRQADAAQKSLTANIESFRTDERAWMEIGSISRETILTPRKFSPHLINPATLPDRMLIYHLYLKNLGKTAAYDIAMHVGESTSGPYELGFSDFVIDKMQNGFLTGKETPADNGERTSFDYVPKVLGPGTLSTAPYTVATTSPYTVVYADTKKIGRYYGYLIGRLDYMDAFNVPHWMKFCLVVINSAGDLKNCNKGNDEDRNAEISPAKPRK